ncbi:MAG: hypothetical protein ABI945_03075 [Nitrospirales bacterium]
MAAVTFRGVDDIKIFVTTVETDGLDAAGQRKGREVDLVQLRLGADDGITNAEQEITDAGIGRRESVFKGNETFLQRVNLRSLPT